MTTDSDPSFEALLEYVRDAPRVRLHRLQAPEPRCGAIQQAHGGGRRRRRTPTTSTTSRCTRTSSPQLFDTILINVTGFFRDPRPGRRGRRGRSRSSLAKRRRPRRSASGRRAARPARRRTRSAMVLAEALGEEAFRERVKIYATDVDEEALAEARHGDATRPRSVEDVRDELLERYFERSDRRLRLPQGPAPRGDLRPQRPRAGRADLADRPARRAATRSCTSTPRRRRGSSRRFHFALNRRRLPRSSARPRCCSRTHDLFAPVDLKRRIFAQGRTADAARPRSLVPRPAPRARADGRARRRVCASAAFDATPVAQLVVDRDGTRRAGQPARRARCSASRRRDVGRPLHDSRSLPAGRAALAASTQAYAERRRSCARTSTWRRRDGERRATSTSRSARSSADGDARSASSVTFTDVDALPPRSRRTSSDSRRELETAYEELQSTVEELETTNEELQSTNEELETTNEELQSTNEELETMNEELQSTNEELETMNDELRQRTERAQRGQRLPRDDPHQPAAGVGRARPRAAASRSGTTSAEDLWGLRADEVEGQHFLGLDIGLPVEQLRQPMRAVLRRRRAAATALGPQPPRAADHVRGGVHAPSYAPRRGDGGDPRDDPRRVDGE